MKQTAFLIALFFLITGTLFSQRNDIAALKKVFLRAEEILDSDPDSALIYYQRILEGLNFNKINNRVALCYSRIGEIYGDRSDFQNAFENYLNFLACAELQKDTSRQISASNNIAIILNQQRKYMQAIGYIQRSIGLSRLTGNQWQIMNCMTNLADMMSAVGKIDSSIIVLKEAKRIATLHHFEEEIPNILANLGNIYYMKAQSTDDKTIYRMAVECSQQAINLIMNMKDPNIVQDDYRKDLAYAYGLKGAALAGLGNYTESETAYQKAIAYYIEQRDLFDLSYLYFELTNVYINAGQNKKASLYLERYDSISKVLYTKENTRAISDMQTKYETERKEQQNQALKTENELSTKTIRQQTIITYVTIGGLSLALALAFFIFRGLKQQRLTNKIITQQKLETEKQKQIIEEHQKEILDSIRYAKRIQKAHLPTEIYVKRTIDRLKKSDAS